MSLDAPAHGIDPAVDDVLTRGVVEITGVSVRALTPTLQNDRDLSTDDVYLERVGGRTYLVAGSDRDGRPFDTGQ